MVRRQENLTTDFTDEWVAVNLLVIAIIRANPR
jgi:hypothetical protein